MTMDAAGLGRLSALLDQAFDLTEAEREPWLAGLSGEDAALVRTLRELLARPASRETSDLLERPPAFTVSDALPAASEQNAGDTVGNYRLERLLGRGGMGEVWLAERYPTIDALAQDWRRHLAGQSVSARPDTLAYRSTRFAHRHRLPLAAGAVAVAAFGLAIGFGATALVITALLLGLGVAVWQARRAREQARIARAALDAMHKQFGSVQMPHLRARLHLERGLARHALGDLNGAREDLAAGLVIRRPFDDAASLWLAEAQVALAECLAALKALDEARALLREAQHIHVQHREVGPHLAMPLQRALAAIHP